MIKVYHNPRCRKSREAIGLLEKKGVDFEIRHYMNDEESMTAKELEEVLDALEMDALDLVRKNESLWKEEYKALELGEDEIILAMIEHPRLMERPIVVKGESAVVARPAEKLEDSVAVSFLLSSFSCGKQPYQKGFSFPRPFY